MKYDTTAELAITTEATNNISHLRNDNIEATSDSFTFEFERHEVVHPSDTDMMEDQDFIDDFLKHGGYLSLDDPDAEDDFENYVSENYSEPEPIGGYAWPLTGRFDPEEVAKQLLLQSNNCCLVNDTDEDDYFFVLTGGGMDLSWDIAEAYVIAGQLPPATLRLPRFAGETWTTDKATTLLACVKSNEVIKSWADSRIRDLMETARTLQRLSK